MGNCIFYDTLKLRSFDRILKKKENAIISNKLIPIERRPDGSLPRMTPGQRKQANSLIRKTCCNYDNGNCLLLDCGEEVPCPQITSYSVNCKYFRRAVLPQDKSLETEIIETDGVKHCTICGKAYISASNNSKYCEHCAMQMKQKQKAEYARKHRLGVEK